MTKVKICGLKRQEDIDMVNELEPDYVGFVFAGKKRKITYDTAAELRRKLNPLIPAVGVFVNESMEMILKLAENHVIQLIQLHGEEGRDYIQILREALSERLEGVFIPIIKAVKVRSTEDILDGEKLPCDMLLLDTFDPNGEHGGTGKGFDQKLIPQLSKPYFLAGGLNWENVGAAVDNLMPFAVDVSSGVETDGWKDKEKVKRFVEAVRNERKGDSNYGE